MPTETAVLAQKSIGNRLESLNKSYLGEIKNPLVGFRMAQANFITPQNVAERLFAGYADNSGFMAKTDNPTVTVTANDNTSYGLGEDQWSTIKSRSDILSLNVLPLYGEAQITLPNGTQTSTYEFVRAMYAWHSMLDYYNWNNLISKLPTVIKVPNNTVGAPNLYKVIIDRSTGFRIVDGSDPVLEANIIGILNPKFVLRKQADMFILRRLFYLYIMMAHYNVAMSYYKQKFASGGSSSSKKARDLVESIYLLVARANYYIENSRGTATYLNKRLKKRQEKYYKNVQRANRLADNLEVSRTDYTDKKNQFEANKGIDRQVTIFNWVTTAVLACVIVAGVVTVNFPFERRTKLTICLSLISATIVSSLILYFAYNRVVAEHFIDENFEDEHFEDEHFEGGALTNYNSIGTSIGTWDSEVDMLNTAILAQAQRYLDNTTFVNNALGSYKAYGNVNYSISRELSFFRALRSNIDNQTGKTKQAANLVKLSSVEQMYRIYLLISWMILAALAVSAYIGFEESPQVRKYSLYVAGFLAIMAFVLYVLEINKRVRNDIRHYYWKMPSTSP